MTRDRVDVLGRAATKSRVSFAMSSSSASPPAEVDEAITPPSSTKMFAGCGPMEEPWRNTIVIQASASRYATSGARPAHGFDLQVGHLLPPEELQRENTLREYDG